LADSLAVIEMISFCPVKNIITAQQREEVIGFLHSATNYFNNGHTRFWPASTGSFLTCMIGLDEAAPWLDHVMPRVADLTGVNWQPKVSSILEYRHNNHVPPHRDISSAEQSTTHTLIMPLNDPDQYGGGSMLVENKEITVLPGDGIIYSHDVIHSVNPIRGGVRYVWVVRLQSDK
jgi:hypothetical protein